MLYLAFVLGFDLLQEQLKEHDLACDEAYDICKNIADDYLKSDYHKDLTISSYDALQKYVLETDLGEYLQSNNF
jgi:hypothetical protein